jgi:hypothetical protein
MPIPLSILADLYAALASDFKQELLFSRVTVVVWGLFCTGLLIARLLISNLPNLLLLLASSKLLALATLIVFVVFFDNSASSKQAVEMCPLCLQLKQRPSQRNQLYSELLD